MLPDHEPSSLHVGAAVAARRHMRIMMTIIYFFQHFYFYCAYFEHNRGLDFSWEPLHQINVSPLMNFVEYRKCSMWEKRCLEKLHLVPRDWNGIWRKTFSPSFIFHIWHSPITLLCRNANFSVADQWRKIYFWHRWHVTTVILPVEYINSISPYFGWIHSWIYQLVLVHLMHVIWLSKHKRSDYFGGDKNIIPLNVLSTQVRCQMVCALSQNVTQKHNILEEFVINILCFSFDALTIDTNFLGLGTTTFFLRFGIKISQINIPTARLIT